MASAPVHDGAVNTHDSISTPAPAHPLPVQSQNEKTVQQPYAMYAMPHGQQYQVYPGQQYLEPPGPVINKGWEMTKYVLHGLSIVCCICGIALVLSVRGINFPLPVVLCPIFAVALIWSIAEFITRAVHKFKSGIHPGAHVAISLLLWLALGLFGGLMLGSYAVLDFWYNDRDCNDSYYGRSSRYNDIFDNDDDDCDDKLSGVRTKILAALGFAIVVGLLHFALFVGACVDTHKHNAAASRAILVMTQPQNWGAMAQGWQPMPPNGTMPPHGQNIPLQDQTYSPRPVASDGAVAGADNGSGIRAPEPSHGPPQQTPNVTEFYTPTR